MIFQFNVIKIIFFDLRGTDKPRMEVENESFSKWKGKYCLILDTCEFYKSWSSL